MTATIAQVRKWRDALAAKAVAEGAPAFLGRPTAWFEDLHWFCPNGHVSGNFLKGDHDDQCLACRAPVCMGPALGEADFARILPAIEGL